MRQNTMYMKDYIEHLDRILASTGGDILIGSGDISHEKAMDKAREEYRKYQNKTVTEIERDYFDILKIAEKEMSKKN